MKKFIPINMVFPLILIVTGVIIVVYTANNPTDSLVARMLSYPSIFKALREHSILMVVSMAGAIIVGILSGIMLSRPKLYYLGRIVENIANIGQTVPPLAVLALLFVIMGIGFRMAVFALFLYSILPILRNTFAGISNVESSVIESAKGMGMSPFRILTRIEMPLAFPIIVAGIRTAVVINVGTAAMATFIGGGGLGDIIVSGISLGRDMVIFTGAALAALIAILLDNVIGQFEKGVIRWS
ncbi:MAG: ABC transporter permease [Firmicutes bacterium ML8_F2]|jgi:osmoprotectant transport system permease protein|nr:MAG: ABC transporter permease [Firmicutes bacterium ML8_F2]